MKKEIPVNIVEDTIDFQEEVETPKVETPKESKTVEYIVYAFVGIILVFIFSLLFGNGFDIEKERAKTLELENLKLEKVLIEKEELRDKFRKILLTENQINKCIELNSSTGSLVDCDLFFNK